MDDLYKRAQDSVSTGLSDEETEALLDAEMEEEEQDRYDALLEGEVAVGKAPVVPVSLSKYTEFSVRINTGYDIEPFSFKGREHFRKVYDTPDKDVLVLASRQSEKSTFLGNKILALSAIIPGFQTLYVSSSATQSKVFSEDRIREPILNSPRLQQSVDPRAQSVFSKRFRNSSMIRLRYAYLTADRARGVKSDGIFIDEIQHILPSNIPIIEQCAFHSIHKYRTYSGTPLTLDNTIAVLWDSHSTQNEWIVPCRACGQEKKRDTWWWNVLGPGNIGKEGLVCEHCHRPINVRDPDAQWASMQPVNADNALRVNFRGFRITQFMVPSLNWRKDILEKREEYSTAQFNNEVCGLSYDSGSRPISKQQLIRASRADVDMSEIEKNVARCTGGVFAGVDWGQDTENSFTVLTLGGYMTHGFQIFFAHRFVGADCDPDVQREKVAKLLGAVHFRVCGADYGGGFGRNDWLMRKFGMKKFVRFQYAPNPVRKIVWNPKLLRFVLHRSEVMGDFFSALKEHRISLPNWKQFSEPHGRDIRNIFTEFNTQRLLMQYKHTHGKTDDTFHSIIYCVLGSMLVKPRPDILIPLKEGNVSFDRGGLDLAA
jgi:hypothetical protein